MLTKLFFLYLVAAVICQEKPVTPVVLQDSPPSSTPSVNTSGVVIPADGSKANPESCVTEGGQQGECVPYYLCQTPLQEGALINIGGAPCTSYIDVCCAASDKTDPSVTLKAATLVQREGCGWRNPEGVVETRSTNNEGESKVAEFPWICAIFMTDPVNDAETKSQEATYIGGGSLIHPSVVLTAAHLVASDGKWRVRAGEWDSDSTREPYPHQDREVASKVVHEDYAKNKLYYDVAVLFLTKPMDIAPNVGLACLPPPREITPEGIRCFATGWGKDKFGKEGKYSNVLKKVEVPTVDRVTCRTQLRKTRLGPLFELHSSFMCAGGELGKDTCKGDGGSPLSCPIQYEKDRYMQSGIVAWGIGCGEDGTPGVYVDVSNLRSWIDDKVAGKGYDPKVYSF